MHIARMMDCFWDGRTDLHPEEGQLSPDLWTTWFYVVDLRCLIVHTFIVTYMVLHNLVNKPSRVAWSCYSKGGQGGNCNRWHQDNGG